MLTIKTRKQQRPLGRQFPLDIAKKIRHLYARGIHIEQASLDLVRNTPACLYILPDPCAVIEPALECQYIETHFFMKKEFDQPDLGLKRCPLAMRLLAQQDDPRITHRGPHPREIGKIRYRPDRWTAPRQPPFSHQPAVLQQSPAIQIIKKTNNVACAKVTIFHAKPPRNTIPFSLSIC